MRDQHYSQIFDHLYDGVIVTDLDGVISDWNRGAERVFGYSKQEMIGETPSVLHYPEESAVLTEKILRGVASDGQWIGEINFICKNGDERTCETTVAPLYDENGDQYGTVGINRDISARKLAERQIKSDQLVLEQRVKDRTRDLTAARSRMQYLVSGCPAVLYISKPLGDFGATYVSPNVSRLTGFPSEAFVQDAGFWGEHIHPEDRERVFRDLKQLFQEDQHSHEYRFRVSDGSFMWIRDEMRLMREPNGEPTEVVGYLMDISQRKIAEKEIEVAHAELEKRVELRTAELHSSKQRLEDALVELQQAERKVIQQERLRITGEMASGISHNLNNMLSPAVSLIDLVYQEPGLSDRARTWVDAIRTGTTDAAELVRRLGTLCVAANQEDRFEEVDVKALISEIPLLTMGKWRDEPLKSGRKISIELELNDVPIISACPADLRQCLTNLIFNAVDAMPQGGIVRVGLHHNNDSVLISVHDDGQGMSAMIRNKCTEPFFTTKDSGSGLGLSSCLEIVHQHNGKLTVESELGIGTKFRIELPVNRECTRSDVSSDAWQVLYIDDEPSVRSSMLLLFEAHGHRIDVAESGPVGMQKFRERDYDIVITDFSMPEMNGRDVAAQVKESRPDTIVLLATGWPASQIEAAPNGSSPEDAIIEKPAKFDQIYAVIRQIKLEE